jgi:hypothetical protein
VAIGGTASHGRNRDRLGGGLRGSGGSFARRLGRLARLGRGSGTATPGGLGRCFLDHFCDGLESRILIRCGLGFGRLFVSFGYRFAGCSFIGGAFTAATMPTAATTAASLFGCAFFGRGLGSFFRGRRGFAGGCGRFMRVGVGIFVVEDRLEALGVGAGIFIPARFGNGEIATMFIIVRQFGFFAAIERINRIAMFARSFIVRVTFLKRLRTTFLPRLDDRISLRIKARLAASTTTATATAAPPATRAALASVGTHVATLTRSTGFLSRAA